MPRKSKNKFEVDGDTVTISREGWPCLAYCTYREDYWEELTTHTWRMDKNHYPINQTLGGGLHRYMMRKWYGEEAFNEFMKNGYIVDHINNEHNDCRISSLEFLKKDYNTAKGQQLDKDVARLRSHLALGITKDFSTGCYQITIGCNVPIVAVDDGGKAFRIDSFKLLYAGGQNRYPIVLNDAEALLLTYEQGEGISLDKTHAACARVYHAPDFQPTEEEAKQAVAFREGIPYLIIGNGMTFIYRIAPDKDWEIPPDYDGKLQVVHMIPR